MNVITSNPIVYGNDSDYSYASGKKKKDKKEDGSKKPGIFSKEKRTERAGKREVRQEKREKRRANRRAKYGARPLEGMVKNGVQKFKDKLPKLNKKTKANGEEVFEKKMPDGQVKELVKTAIQIVPQGSGEPAYYDKADINTEKEVVQTKLPDGSVDLHKEYSADETEKAKGADGKESVFKKEDTEDDDGTTKKGWSSLSTPVKAGIIIGGIAVLSFIGYKIYKGSKKGK